MKLYENDSYLREFTATVTEIVDGQTVVLDQTAFYPEGGGQPSDWGSLGQWKVVDVREKQGKILHKLEPLDRTPQVGEVVCGKIDWKRRFAHMQNHTGEHLFSGLVHSRFGYENVGFHMGTDEVTMDFSGELTPGDLEQLEKDVNQIIWEDRPITVFYPTKEELASLEYRSKKEIEGQVRLVNGGDVDLCACCGTHVTTTAQVGMVKVLSHSRYKGGTRVAILCGAPLLAYLQMLLGQTTQIGNLLSVKQTGLAEGVDRQKKELVDAKYKGDQWQKIAIGHQVKLILGTTQEKHIIHNQADLTVVQARMLATGLCDGGREIALVYGNGAYAVASKAKDVRAFTKALNQLTQGKGGGGPQLTQGSYGENETEIPALFHQHFAS